MRAVPLLAVELRHDAIAQLLVGKCPREEDDEAKEIEHEIAEPGTEAAKAIFPHYFLPALDEAAADGVVAGVDRS